MPIGIVSSDLFDEELTRLTTVKKQKVVTPDLVPSIIDLDRPGRDAGDVNIPDSLRQIIGEDAVINGRQSALGLAGMFGISDSSVSAYTKGTTSTASYNSPVPSIVNHINRSRQRTIKKASGVLTRALDSISQEKLDNAEARDLSAIAKDMAVVIKNLEPQVDPSTPSDKQTPQFVIFAPTFRDERSFDHITVSE